MEGAFEKVVTDRATEYNTRRPQAKSGTWFLSTLESFSGKPEAGPTGVVENPTVRIYLPQRSWFSDVAPAMNWHSFENKRILGTVPVEEDGSAYFEVPGNTYVYF